jgi:hypothetical protein
MRRVNRWRAPQWVQWWMLLATKAGGGWLWGAVGAALLCSSDALRFRALEAAACAVAIGIVVFHKIKRRVCRPRPRDFEPHCWACIATKDKLSFPSKAHHYSLPGDIVHRFVLPGDHARAADSRKPTSPPRA